MGCKFRFVRRADRETVADAVQFFKEQKDHLLAAWEAFEEEHPLARNWSVPDIVEDSGLFRGWEFAGGVEERYIGYRGETRFHFSAEDGFWSPASIRSFAETNPDWIIEDEYGKEVPLEEMLQISRWMLISDC